MLLALDIGNSTIVAALFDKETKLAETTVSSTVQRSPDETWEIVQSLINQTDGAARPLEGVGISSVVPFLTQLFTSLSLT
jgi:pantothenate kinase type III